MYRHNLDSEKVFSYKSILYFFLPDFSTIIPDTVGEEDSSIPEPYSFDLPYSCPNGPPKWTTITRPTQLSILKTTSTCMSFQSHIDLRGSGGSGTGCVVPGSTSQDLRVFRTFRCSSRT